MNKNKVQNRVVVYFSAVVSAYVVMTGVAVSVFLLLLPTFLTLSSQDWLEILVGVVVFAIHVLYIISGVNALLRREDGRRMIVDLSAITLAVWFVNLVLFVAVLGMDVRLYPFIYRIATCGWIWYLILLWFYTRPFVREVFSK